MPKVSSRSLWRRKNQVLTIEVRRSNHCAEAPVERFSRLVPQVASDDMRGRLVDEVPSVDPVVPSQVQVVPAPPPPPGVSPPGLKVHDAHCDHSAWVVRPVQQDFDLRGCPDEVLGEIESCFIGIWSHAWRV